MVELTSKPEIMKEAEFRENDLTDRIISAAIEVHRHLGPGLLESAYEECLCYELSQIGLRFERQVHLPVSYKAIRLDCAYVMDLVVEGTVVVEIKATEDLANVHTAQLRTYLKASHKQVGLLINFNKPMLRNGLKRVVNRYQGPKPTQESR
jgi:GxxExxY protein